MKTADPIKLGFSPERLGRINAFMETAVSQQRTAGMVTLIARRGQIVHFEAHGYQDRATKKPMEKDTIVRIYSMTKPITSVALMMLLEQGKVHLFDPVSRFIPAFKKMQVLGKNGSLVDAVREVTIHDLLTHTAGLTYGNFEAAPAHEMYLKADWFSSSQTNAERIQSVTEFPLFVQPGTKWHYSIATDVVGHVVERIADQSLAHYFDEKIFQPLGMVDSSFRVSQEKRDRFATLYVHTPEDPFSAADAPIFKSYFDAKGFSGGGGLVSTATDYFRFAQMLLNNGEFDGIQLLGRKTVDWMHVNHLPSKMLPMDLFGMPMPGIGFGLGLRTVMDIGAVAVPNSVGNYGWGGWASTNFWVDPEEELIGIMMNQKIPHPEIPLMLGEDFRTAVYQAIVQ